MSDRAYLAALAALRLNVDVEIGTVEHPTVKVCGEHVGTVTRVQWNKLTRLWIFSPQRRKPPNMAAAYGALGTNPQVRKP